jgi:LysM repeat protein
MNKKNKTYFMMQLLFAFCLLPIFFNAQTKSTDIKTINGKKYYIHKVEKGQSLYAIAKTYNMDVNSILAENDDAIDGLNAGQELKIPFESLMKTTSIAIDTNKYVYHKIQKGETVYAITKKYNIDDKIINTLNPNISKGIKEGEYLIVGEKKKFVSNNTITTQGLKDTILYTVNQGETLYGLTVKFNVLQSQIIASNPSAKDGIKQGQLLKIPQKKVITTTSNMVKDQVVNTSTNTFSSINNDTIVFNKPKKTAYNIGLLLPFKLAELELINIDELARAKASFPATQALAMDFYTGFKKAVDSLSSKDFDVSLSLFDIDEKDSLKIETLCKSYDFKKLDAVFGPLYSTEFKLVSSRAKTLSIPVVSPLTQQNKILYNNALVSKINPSQYTLIEGLADYCSDSLMSTSNIMIVNTVPKDLPYLKTFKAEYNDNLLLKGKTLKDSIKVVKGIAGVKSAYVEGKKNVVVVLTNNHVYLQDFITQLASFSEKKDIMLVGFNSVTSIDNLDQGYLNKLQFHFATANHVDYENPVTRQLARQYQDVFSTDPSDYYFQGFDIAAYYLSNLKNQGPAFFLNLDKIPGKGLSTDFKFYRPDTYTGFENQALSIYKYFDFKLVKTGW